MTDRFRTNPPFQILQITPANEIRPPSIYRKLHVPSFLLLILAIQPSLSLSEIYTLASQLATSHFLPMVFHRRIILRLPSIIPQPSHFLMHRGALSVKNRQYYDLSQLHKLNNLESKKTFFLRDSVMLPSVMLSWLMALTASRCGCLALFRGTQFL